MSNSNLPDAVASRWRPESDASTRQPAPRPRGGRRRTLVVLAVFLALGAYHIHALRFLYDDSFITFRYASNLAHGHGLVYNLGERVEGYSNFLWALILAGVMALGGRPEAWSPVLGALGALAALGVALLAARRRRISVILTGLSIASSTSWAAWGTGGLETGAFMLCLTAGVLLLGASLQPSAGATFDLRVVTRGPGQPRPRLATRPYFASAVVFAIASLMRVDGFLVGALAGAALAWRVARGRLSFARFAQWSAIVAACVIAQALWRWSYYGAILPHTAAVKAPGLEHLTDGLTYLGGAFLDLHLYLPLGAVALALALRGSFAIPRTELGLIGVVLVPYALYLATTGGDFMPAYRFVAPLVPLIGYLGAAACCAIAARLAAFHHPHLGRAAAWLVVLAFVALNLESTARQLDVWTKGEMVSIGWARQETADWIRIGDLLSRVAAPSDTLATSAGGAVPFRSGLYTIEMNGLTAPTLGDFRHRPSRRPGHLITLAERSMVEHPPQILLGHPLVHPTPASLALGLELRPEWRDRVLAHYQAVGLELPGTPPRFVGCALRNDVVGRIIAAGRRARGPATRR